MSVIICSLESGIFNLTLLEFIFFKRIKEYGIVFGTYRFLKAYIKKDITNDDVINYINNCDVNEKILESIIKKKPNEKILFLVKNLKPFLSEDVKKNITNMFGFCEIGTKENIDNNSEIKMFIGTNYEDIKKMSQLKKEKKEIEFIFLGPYWLQWILHMKIKTFFAIDTETSFFLTIIKTFLNVLPVFFGFLVVPLSFLGRQINLFFSANLSFVEMIINFLKYSWPIFISFSLINKLTFITAVQCYLLLTIHRLINIFSNFTNKEKRILLKEEDKEYYLYIKNQYCSGVIIKYLYISTIMFFYFNVKSIILFTKNNVLLTFSQNLIFLFVFFFIQNLNLGGLFFFIIHFVQWKILLEKFLYVTKHIFS